MNRLGSGVGKAGWEEKPPGGRAPPLQKDFRKKYKGRVLPYKQMPWEKTTDSEFQDYRFLLRVQAAKKRAI